MLEGSSLFKKRGGFQNKQKKNIYFFLSPILIIPSILVLISSVLIFSIQKQSVYNDAFNHLMTGVFGCVIAIFMSYIPLEKLKNYIIPFYLFSLLSLVLIYFFGISTYGAQRWLSTGLFTFQPSEVAKLSTLLVLAKVLDKKIILSIKDLLIPSIVVVLPWTLIFFQPDLGTSLVLIFLFLIMLYWSQMPTKWLLMIFSCLLTALFSFLSKYLLLTWILFMAFLAFRSFKNQKIFVVLITLLHILVAKITPLFWDFGLKDYQKDRLILFLDPGRDPLGGGYHLLQSKISIGSGGVFGTGLLNGKLTNLQFIPEQHTDFIFSALGEESGFVGSIFVVFLFFILITQLLNISKNARTDFESLLVIGVASIFFFQIIINIYMTLGLGPVTGIPLPFMSYGRTSLIINFMFIGLVLSASKRLRSLKKS